MSKFKLQTIKFYRQLIQTYHIDRERLPEFILVKLCAELDARVRSIIGYRQSLGFFQSPQQSIYDEISAMWIAYLSYYHTYLFDAAGLPQNNFVFDLIWPPYVQDYQSICPGILSADFFNKQLGAAILFRRRQYEELLRAIPNDNDFIFIVGEIPIEPYMHATILDRLLPLIRHDMNPYDHQYTTDRIMHLTFGQMNLSEVHFVRVFNALFPHDITVERSRQTIHRIKRLKYGVVIPRACHSRLIDVILEVLRSNSLYCDDREMLFDLLQAMELCPAQAATFEARMIDFINGLITSATPDHLAIKLLQKVPIPVTCQPRLIEFLLNMLSSIARESYMDGMRIMIATLLRSMPLSFEQNELLNAHLGASVLPVATQRVERAMLPLPSLPRILPKQKSKEEAIFDMLDLLIRGESRFFYEDIFKVEIPSELTLTIALKLLAHIEQYPVHKNKHSTKNAIRLLNRFDLPRDNELTKRIIFSYVQFYLELTDIIELLSFDNDVPLFGQAKIADVAPLAISQLLHLMDNHEKHIMISKAFQQLECIVIPHNMMDSTLKVLLSNADDVPKSACTLFMKMLANYTLNAGQEDLIFRFFFNRIKKGNEGLITDLKTLKMPLRWHNEFVNLLLDPSLWEKVPHSHAKIMSTLDKLLAADLEVRYPLIKKLINYFNQKGRGYSATQLIMKLTRSLLPFEQVRLAGMLDKEFGIHAFLFTDCLLGRLKRNAIKDSIERALPPEMVEQVRSFIPKKSQF